MGEPYVEATREAFGDLVKKPPLTDKLLGKPPFKFLLDLITATIHNSGYLSGLFSDDEVAAASGSKETKVAFLEKAILAAEHASGKKLDVRPGKIVAGQEADKTNAFLQALASAARRGDGDGADVVAKVMAGEKFSGASPAGSASSNKENGAGEKKERKAAKEKPAKEKSSSRSKDKTSTSKERSSSKEKKPSKSSSEKKSSKDGKERSSKDGKERKKKRESSKEARPSSPEREPTTDSLAPPPPTNGFHEEPSPRSRSPRDPSPRASSPKAPSPEPRKSSALDRAAEGGSAGRITRSARPASSAGMRPGSSLGGRPGTAARAAPRLKRKELGEVEQREASATSQRETAGLIGAEAAKDEDADFIVEEPVGGAPDLGLSDSDDPGQVHASDLHAQDHGGLVRKILETKKELESGLAGDSDDGRGGRAVLVYDEKERERTKKEAQKLQGAVQDLTKTVHPLGRLVDLMQEDVDSMVKELEQWREEARKNRERLSRLQGTEAGGNVESLKSRLVELEEQLATQRDANAGLKAGILGSQKKLANLVAQVAR